MKYRVNGIYIKIQNDGGGASKIEAPAALI